MTMREWWVKVYVRCGVVDPPHMKHLDRFDAVEGSRMGNGKVSPRINSRIHVRLKPEGAPKRYAYPDEREWWERNPEYMRQRAAGLVP